MSKEKMHNPVIRFAEELPVFYAEGDYEEVKGLPEEYDNGLVKRLVSENPDECDIEWFRWDKTIAPFDECIQLDIDAYNTGAPCISRTCVNYFNEPGDSAYTVVVFPTFIREKDYLAEICYFELEKDFVGFELLSKTRKVMLGETGLSVMIPCKSKDREKTETEISEDGLIFASKEYGDWLPKTEIFVWEKDGDFDHFADYLSGRFDVREVVKETITLADGTCFPGMKCTYYTDKTDSSCSNIEWALDLGDRYVSLRFEYARDFDYIKAVVLGILASLKKED